MAQDIKDMKLNWEPNQKELDEFAKEKLNIYKGTYIVCLVYGLAALGLVLAGAFTEWGREYIFGKMLPATATFVFGALFIVLYLTMSIYDLKPKQNRTKQDLDNGIICPDYWKLQMVEHDNEKIALKNQANNANMITAKDFKIEDKDDPRLQFKCVLDENIQEKTEMQKSNDPRYKKGYVSGNSNVDKPDYIYVEKDTNSDATKNLYKSGDLATKYARLTSIGDLTTETRNGQLLSGIGSTTAAYTADNFALKCNEVYPRILEDMDKDTPEKNKYRCEYAKACDIAWTGLGCKYDVPKI